MIASSNNVAYMGLTSADSLEATGAITPADALGVDPSMSEQDSELHWIDDELVKISNLLEDNQ